MKTPFIVFDGMDGSGKGTQISLLLGRLGDEGKKFIFTREPGGTPFSEKLRNLFNSTEGTETSARTQSLLMWTARSDTHERVIVPALNVGTMVIDDRGDTSTLAYQAYAKEAPELEDEFWRMRKFVFGDYPPTLYILLDLPAREAKRRVDLDSSRTKSAFDMQPLEWYERVRQGFEAFRNELPNHVIVVNGDRPPEVIHEEIYQIVADHCGWK